MHLDLEPNLQNIKAWHDALISGQYQQATQVLRHQVHSFDESTGEHTGSVAVSYCCLGVACQLTNPSEEAWSEEHEQGEMLSWSARQWLGINDSDPVLTIPAHLRHLVDGEEESLAHHLNDNAQFSFNQIAACIRETWPEAFDT